jgi:hypothetical protein
MSKSNGTKRLRAEDGRVDLTARPGWIPAQERLPAVGEQVLCAGGPGEVVALLGKTGDGSRLLEIRLGDVQAKPFFAAASNVLVAPAA